MSNLPADARGRLQTILALAEETAAQAASGTMVVVDTGLGTAQYHLLESGEESSATDDQPDPDTGAVQPSAAWADQLDTLDDFLPFSPGLPLTVLSQPTAPTLADTGAVVTILSSRLSLVSRYSRHCQVHSSRRGLSARPRLRVESQQRLLRPRPCQRSPRQSQLRSSSSLVSQVPRHPQSCSHRQPLPQSCSRLRRLRCSRLR